MVLPGCILFIYLLLAVLGLHCSMGFFPVAVHRLLIAVAPHWQGILYH